MCRSRLWLLYCVRTAICRTSALTRLDRIPPVDHDDLVRAGLFIARAAIDAVDSVDQEMPALPLEQQDRPLVALGPRAVVRIHMDERREPFERPAFTRDLEHFPRQDRRRFSQLQHAVHRHHEAVLAPQAVQGVEPVVPGPGVEAELGLRFLPQRLLIKRHEHLARGAASGEASDGNEPRLRSSSRPRSSYAATARPEGRALARPEGASSPRGTGAQSASNRRLSPCRARA